MQRATDGRFWPPSAISHYAIADDDDCLAAARRWPLSDLRIGLASFRRVGSGHFILRSVGADGTLFTADDLIPRFATGPDRKPGLLNAPSPGD